MPGQSSMEDGVPNQEIDWQSWCDQETFEKCRKDEKFPYIAALGRVINAFNFVYSVMTHSIGDNSPAAMRDRLNSYLFGSAIMYEALELVRNMGKAFVGDDLYQNGLRLLLKDDAARTIEHAHLKPARHGAVFHFDAETFKETIDKGLSNECLFISARGQQSRMGIYYSYTDIVAAEILVGFPAGGDKFDSVLADAMAKTRNLATDFANRAEPLIAHHLQRWGFVPKFEPIPDLHASPESPPHD
jgi:hypothetical protein